MHCLHTLITLSDLYNITIDISSQCHVDNLGLSQCLSGFTITQVYYFITSLWIDAMTIMLCLGCSVVYD